MNTLLNAAEKVGDLYRPPELQSIFVNDYSGIVQEAVHAYSQPSLPHLERLARALASGSP